MMSMLNNIAAACGNPSFFGLGTWYKYLQKTTDALGNCTFTINNVNDYWLIGLGILDILLRLAALAAIVYVIYGGIQYIVSQGEPEKTKHALGTIMNAVIGLVIAVIAAALVAFIAKTLASGA